jgi:hypothetical protein
MATVALSALGSCIDCKKLGTFVHGLVGVFAWSIVLADGDSRESMRETSRKRHL